MQSKFSRDDDDISGFPERREVQEIRIILGSRAASNTNGMNAPTKIYRKVRNWFFRTFKEDLRMENLDVFFARLIFQLELELGLTGRWEVTFWRKAKNIAQGSHIDKYQGLPRDIKYLNGDEDSCRRINPEFQNDVVLNDINDSRPNKQQSRHSKKKGNAPRKSKEKKNRMPHKRNQHRPVKEQVMATKVDTDQTINFHGSVSAAANLEEIPMSAMENGRDVRDICSSQDTPALDMIDDMSEPQEELLAVLDGANCPVQAETFHDPQLSRLFTDADAQEATQDSSGRQPLRNPTEDTDQPFSNVHDILQQPILSVDDDNRSCDLEMEICQEVFFENWVNSSPAEDTNISLVNSEDAPQSNCVQGGLVLSGGFVFSPDDWPADDLGILESLFDGGADSCF